MVTINWGCIIARSREGKIIYLNNDNINYEISFNSPNNKLNLFKTMICLYSLSYTYSKTSLNKLSEYWYYYQKNNNHMFWIAKKLKMSISDQIK